MYLPLYFYMHNFSLPDLSSHYAQFPTFSVYILDLFLRSLFMLFDLFLFSSPLVAGEWLLVRGRTTQPDHEAGGPHDADTATGNCKKALVQVPVQEQDMGTRRGTFLRANTTQPDHEAYTAATVNGTCTGTLCMWVPPLSLTLRLIQLIVQIQV